MLVIITPEMSLSVDTGGSYLSLTVVKPDFGLAQIFLPNFLV